MRQLFLILMLCSGLATTAGADVWRWVDAHGNTHFVDTRQSIFTWVDEFNNVHFSDTPDHEDAVSVKLVWHSPGSLENADTDDAPAANGSAGPAAVSAETDAARSRDCERATEILESFINAPQLYRIDDGEREYLSRKEMDQAVADAREQRDQLCKR